MNPQLQKAYLTKPQTRIQIKDWVSYFLSFNLHDHVICKEHNSQLDYIESGFLNLHSSCVFIASRNAGKSYGAAVLCLLDCHFKPGINVAVAAFQRSQSDYIYEYVCEFLTNLAKRINCDVIDIAKIDKDNIFFNNGSRISLFSGAKSQANIKGCHPNILIIDEADLFSSAQFDGIANALEAGGKFQRRLDILSTNYTVAGEGVVLKQIERYDEFNKNKMEGVLPCKVFRVCLLDILEKCSANLLCFNEQTKKPCPLWGYCKGKAKEGQGFYKITSAMETMRDSSRQVFESQMLLLRPSSESAYFGDFDLIKNVSDPDLELNPNFYTFISFDFGGGKCPNFALVMQKDKKTGIYYVIDEFSIMGNLDLLIQRIKFKYPNSTEFDCFCDPKGNAGDGVKGNITNVESLRKHGYHPRWQKFGRDSSAQEVARLISPADGIPRLKVNKRCQILQDEIFSAECKLDQRHKPTAFLADKGKDDALDNLRYIVSWTIKPNYSPKQRGCQARFF